MSFSTGYSKLRQWTRKNVKNTEKQTMYVNAFQKNEFRHCDLIVMWWKNMPNEPSFINCKGLFSPQNSN